MLRAIERIITPNHPTRSPDSTSPLSPRPDSGLSGVSRSGTFGPPPSLTSRSRVRDWFRKKPAPACNRPTLSNLEPASETLYHNQGSGFYPPLSPTTPDLNSPFDSHLAKREENIEKPNDQEATSVLSSDKDNYGNLEPRRKSTRPTPAREAREKRVQRVFDIIKQLKNEEYTTEDILIVEELTESAFKDLRDKIQREDDDELKHYFESDLCYDYPYRSEQKDHIVFRMPSKLHDHVSRRIFMKLANQLESLSDRDTNSEGLSQILSKPFYMTGSARITFGEGPHGKSPDESFQYPDCTYPGLVIEVSWSQRPKELPKRAKDFITKSKGEVRTVISIDINDSYEKRQSGMPGEAKFSIWRADWVSGNKVVPRMSVDNQVFQDQNGKFNPSASGLHLTFEDFLCRNVANMLGPDNPRLIVEANELYRWVQQGLAALNIPPPGLSAEQNNASEQQVLPASPPDSHAGGGEMSQNQTSNLGQPVGPRPQNNSPQGQAPLETQVERPPRRARLIGAHKISAYFRRQHR